MPSMYSSDDVSAIHKLGLDLKEDSVAVVVETFLIGMEPCAVLLQRKSSPVPKAVYSVLVWKTGAILL